MKKKIGMSRALRDRWVRALKSGLYQQARNTYGIGQPAQCCLGVLCELMQTKDVDMLDTVLSERQQQAFVQLNDNEGCSFDQIAAKVPSIVRAERGGIGFAEKLVSDDNADSPLAEGEQ